MKLSILICTIQERKQFLDRLLSVLLPQSNKDIQVIVQSDNRQLSIGAKRNLLISKSTGDFLSFVDDDDLISNNYCNLILNAVNNNQNCTHCSLNGVFTTDGKDPKRFQHSNKYFKWRFNKDISMYERPPNHLNAIKSNIVKQVMFQNVNRGQDRTFSFNIMSKMTKQAYIGDILYYYDFRSKK